LLQDGVERPAAQWQYAPPAIKNDKLCILPHFAFMSFSIIIAINGDYCLKGN
jgi:hypothetical protein